MKNGTIQIYKDLKIYSQLRKKIKSESKENLSLQELRTYTRIRRDLSKLPPFYFVIALPMTGVLMPMYIMCFPNAFPTHYTPEEFLKKREIQKIHNQEEGYRHLLDQIKLVTKTKDDSELFKNLEEILAHEETKQII
jgi:hypothetical protein